MAVPTHELSRNKGIDLGRGNPTRLLLQLAVPAILSMFFQSLYTLIDTAFVSRLGHVPLAALSYTVPLTYIVLSISRGIGVGVISLISNARGEQNNTQVTNLAQYSLQLMLFCLAPFLLLLVPALFHPAFAALGAKGEVMLPCYRYMIYLAPSFLLMGYALICEAIFTGHGETGIPMRGMVLGNIINVILDPLLIFGLEMGIEGASLATLIGWGCTGLYLTRQIFKRKFPHPSFAVSSDMFPIWKQILAVGALVSLAMVTSPISITVLNILLSKNGIEAVGAWNIALRVEQFGLLLFYGLNNAVIPFIGFNYGKKDYFRILHAVKFSLILSILGMTLIGGLFFFFSTPIVRIFKAGPEVASLAGFALKFNGCAYMFVAVEMTLNSVAQGVKRTRLVLFIVGMRLLLLRIPLAIILGMYWQVHGIYLSHPISMMIAGIVCSFLLYWLVKSIKKDISPALLSRVSLEI